MWDTWYDAMWSAATKGKLGEFLAEKEADETDIPTQPACTQAPPWISRAHGDPQRPENSEPSTGSRTQEAVGLDRQTPFCGTP